MTDARVVLSGAFRLDPSGLERLRSAGVEPVGRYDLVRVGPPAELTVAMDGAFAVVAGSESYPSSVLASVPWLRAVPRPGVGYDAVDVEAATGLGIAILITPGANEVMVPGYPEARSRAQAQAHGVEVPDPLLRSVRELTRSAPAVRERMDA